MDTCGYYTHTQEGNFCFDVTVFREFPLQEVSLAFF